MIYLNVLGGSDFLEFIDWKCVLYLFCYYLYVVMKYNFVYILVIDIYYMIILFKYYYILLYLGCLYVFIIVINCSILIWLYYVEFLVERIILMLNIIMMFMV